MALLHLAIGFEKKKVPIETIQKALGANVAWARYAPNCWLVSTEDSAQKVAKKVRAVISESDSVLVVEVNRDNTYGWVEKEIWEWMKGV